MSFGLPFVAFAQGEDQGFNQGENQGFDQGNTQGADQGIEASNENTGADSDNTNTVETDSTTSTDTQNTSDDETSIAGDATTGDNVNSQNTGDTGVTSGDAHIGVTQVKNDNTAVKNGNVLLSTTAQQGTTGDLTIGLDAATSLVGADGNVKSVQATNSSTGANSDNINNITTTTNEITEVQNDGAINNDVTVSAKTGGNHADQNTGDASVISGNANVAASLVNLLNTTVENGNIIVSTTDVYGDVQGNIYLPDFNQLATLLTGNGPIIVDAQNSNTGADSTNTIDVALNETNTTTINSNATVDTTITAQAITGQNDSLENTGGAEIATGDASVQASNTSLTNTTVKDASLGIVIINALNRFIGFIVGSDNVATPLSEEETLTYVNAQNEDTGEGSHNASSITDNQNHTTTVSNQATITNDIDASAITGQNSTNKNTGKGHIKTGEANIAASAVNIANTTVKNGNLAVYIVNILGNFFGNVLFGETQLALPYDTSTPIAIDAENSETGAGSTNQINVHVSRSDNTTLHNSSSTRTTFDTTLDTGNNRANKNTSGADITTGDSQLHISSRSIANTIALGSPWNNSPINFHGNNNATGADSTNTTNLDVTETFSVNINNTASAETYIPGSANTGNNESNQNTLGGAIATGLIDFKANIGNILNRVFLALNPATTTLSATGENYLTGNDSTNSNTVSFARNFLLSLLNTATAGTFLDFLFNTGGNTANENTFDAHIATGSICGQGTIENDENTIGDLSAFTSATVTNTAIAQTNILALATTGNNTLTQNTAGSVAQQNTPCPPEPTPPPNNGDNGGGDDNGDEDGDSGDGGGGSDGGDEQNGSGGGDTTPSSDNGGTTVRERIPRIASAVERVLKGVGGLGLGYQQKSPTSSSFPFAPFLMGSITTLGSAAWADHKARKHKRYLLSL